MLWWPNTAKNPTESCAKALAIFATCSWPSPCEQSELQCWGRNRRLCRPAQISAARALLVFQQTHNTADPPVHHHTTKGLSPPYIHHATGTAAYLTLLSVTMQSAPVPILDGERGTRHDRTQDETQSNAGRGTTERRTAFAKKYRDWGRRITFLFYNQCYSIEKHYLSTKKRYEHLHYPEQYSRSSSQSSSKT